MHGPWPRAVPQLFYSLEPKVVGEAQETWGTARVRLCEVGILAIGDFQKVKRGEPGGYGVKIRNRRALMNAQANRENHRQKWKEQVKRAKFRFICIEVHRLFGTKSNPFVFLMSLPLSRLDIFNIRLLSW